MALHMVTYIASCYPYVPNQTWKDDDFENFEGHSKSRHIRKI